MATTSHDGARWSAELPTELDSPRTLVLAFADPAMRDGSDALSQLDAAFPEAAVIGCSSAGQIQDAALHDGGLNVAVCRFDHVALRRAETAVAAPEDSLDAGAALARRLRAPGLRAVIVLSDGLSVNGSELARGLSDGVGAGVPVSGGLAADGDHFGSTWILDERRRPRAGVAAAVGLYGERLVVGHGSRGGWERFGPERVITRSSGNVLHELDGRPALALYKEYLGRKADGLPATALLFPLELTGGPLGGDGVVRTILAVDEDEQTMTFAGDVPQGCLGQLMRTNFDRLVDGSEQAAESAASPHAADTPVLSLAISCVGRRLVLGEFCEDEVEVALDSLPTGSSQIGFYSYGELAPGGFHGCELHNQTMTITTLSEI